MNQRQRKKIARIENSWHPNKKIENYDCPTCSWCALSDDEATMPNHKILSRNTDYWGTTWDFEVKCPFCKTVFEYSDSNM